MNVLIFINKDKKSSEKIFGIVKSVLKFKKLRVCNLKDIQKNIVSAKDKYNIGLSIGGDGTFVSMVRNFHKNCEIFIGINHGQVGFLTELAMPNLAESLEMINMGKFSLTTRSLLKIHVSAASGIASRYYEAVNDAYFLRSQNKGMVHLGFGINGEGQSEVRGDGLIISTATGSTAYSLAAGGPILYPTLKGFVVTPINCHSLGHKPVVLPEDAFVDVIQMSSKPKVTLFIDGHILVPLTVHHKIRICLSDSVYKVGLLDKNFFFNNLSEKLHWR